MGIDLTEGDEEQTQFINAEGWRTLRIVDFEEGTSPNKNPYIKYTFEDEDGAIMKHSFFTTKKARWVLKRLAIACGREGSIKDFNPEDLGGRSVDVFLKKNDKGYTEAGTEFRPAGAIKARGPETAKPVGAAAKNNTAPLDDDDIPF